LWTVLRDGVPGLVCVSGELQFFDHMSSPCNCCEEPPCEAPELEFISIEGECEVCGYALPAHEDLEEGEECLRFAKRTDSLEYVYHQDDDPPATRDQEVSESITRQAYVDGEGACAVRFFSGSYDYEEVLISGGDPEDPFYSQTTTVSTSAGLDGVWSGTRVYVVSPNSEDNDSVASTDPATADFAPDNDWSYTSPGVYTRSNPTGYETSRTETVSFSEPVETCEPTLPDWPAWEGESEDELEAGQGYETSAVRSKSGTCNLTLTLRSVKWRIKHAPSGTCYLKAWIKKTFTPTTGATTETDLTPYEWTGTGNPCLDDATKAVDHADNVVKGTATEETFPEEAGVTTFEIVKFSCVEGYEPDISDEENPQPNGFPDPTWEASPP
jgi:hypothetical protein